MDLLSILITVVIVVIISYIIGKLWIASKWRAVYMANMSEKQVVQKLVDSCSTLTSSYGFRDLESSDDLLKGDLACPGSGLVTDSFTSLGSSCSSGNSGACRPTRPHGFIQVELDKSSTYACVTVLTNLKSRAVELRVGGIGETGPLLAILPIYKGRTQTEIEVSFEFVQAINTGRIYAVIGGDGARIRGQLMGCAGIVIQ